MVKIAQVPTPQRLPGHPGDTSQQTNPIGVPRIVDLEALLQNVLLTVLMFAGIALLVMLLYGGFTWLTAGGNAQKVEGAQKTITSAILGLVLVSGSFLILRILGAFALTSPEQLFLFNIFLE